MKKQIALSPSLFFSPSNIPVSAQEIHKPMIMKQPLHKVFFFRGEAQDISLSLSLTPDAKLLLAPHAA